MMFQKADYRQMKYPEALRTKMLKDLSDMISLSRQKSGAIIITLEQTNSDNNQTFGYITYDILTVGKNKRGELPSF